MAPTYIDLLEQVEATSGTNKKIALLADEHDLNCLSTYLMLAVDERYVFNVKKLKKQPVPNDSRHNMHDDTAFFGFHIILERLRERDLTGDAALDKIVEYLEMCSSRQIKWLLKLLFKDLASTKIGTHICNAVWPGLVLDFRCMLAEPIESIDRLTLPLAGEIKHNGVRTFWFLDKNGKVFTPVWLQFLGSNDAVPYGRSGLPIWNFRVLIPYIEALGLTNTVIDCECMVDQSLEDAMSVYGHDFEKTIDVYTNKKGIITKAGEQFLEDRARCEVALGKLQACIIDLLTLDEFETCKCTRSYDERRAYIEGDFALQVEMLSLAERIRVDEHMIFETLEAALEYSEYVINILKLEGLILKEIKGPYEFKRSFLWVKVKEEVEADVVILDVIRAKQTYAPDGSPEPPMMGKFLVTDGTRVFEVGTGKGWTKEFYQQTLIDKEDFIKKVMKLNAQRFTKDSAICPRFGGIWRPDKLWTEIVTDEIIIAAYLTFERGNNEET